MQNLRILDVKIVDSSNIEITFTAELTPNLVTSNISITADASNVPDSEVLGISISSSKLKIKCLPLTPYAQYYIELISTAANPFMSLHGDAIIVEDGVSNKYLIIGPLESDNIFKNYLRQFMTDEIYNVYDDNTIISKYIQALSVNLSKALYDIRLVKNENYLSNTILDERKVRGAGPFDRLDEEGAYQLLRVARTPSDTKVTSTISFDEFPYYPITLQSNSATEILTVDSTDDTGKFNINTFTLNLSSYPVTKVTSIVFTQATSTPVFTYDIETLGYQVKESRYDQDYASTYLQLEDNQVKLSTEVLQDSTFSANDIIRIEVVYEYKNLGIVVNSDSLTVYTSTEVIRETLPPIINVFNLKHAPIVDSNNDIYTTGGVTFTDPNNNLTGASHPAFVTEIPFRLNGMPNIVGQYSIDYETGTVYVFGADSNNDGTGAYPPLATYSYRLVYENEIDYTYDTDLIEIVALPNGSLINYAGTVSFEYEQVLIPGIDYNGALHQEELAERAENRLVALNAVKTLNTPITNVFRVYNETSGEIYNIVRWTDDKIYFRYQNSPRIISQTNERTTFNTISNEMLFVNDTLTNSALVRIFKIFLDNNKIMASSEDGIGSFVNTSLIFSEKEIFNKEMWYNRSLEISDNLEMLLTAGEYIVDYSNGVIYCAVSSTQSNSIGFATYKKCDIVPSNPHLISVDDIYYRIDPLAAKGTKFNYTSFEDGSILLNNPQYSDELYLNDSTDAPYKIYNNQIGVFIDAAFVSGVTSPIKSIRGLYEYEDFYSSTNPLNFVDSCISSSYDLTVSPISKQCYGTVLYDDGYYVNVNENIPFLSTNISYDFTVTRVSDSLPLWDVSGVIVEGNPIRLELSGLNSPNDGDLVSIVYSFTITDLSRVVIDYNKGDLFVDYTYLADEIILSYEYGDNVLDFRSSTSVPKSTEYYVSYKCGALRDALYRNFGNLINIPELTNFDIDFDRERYRDALTAALTSFIQGPTIPAIKNIGKTISHVQPEIIESVFQGWSLGNSLLNPQPISTTGTFQLLPGKYNNGPLIDSDQTITFPMSSNIKLEEGTFETWILPQWNGLDNDSSLIFNILQDGYSIDPSKIFIGASEYHPTVIDDEFTLDKTLGVTGTPNKNKDGIFIYYDKDISGNFDRWYLEVVDGYVSTSAAYKIKITSNGNIYDAKSMTLLKPSNLTMFTGTNTVNITIRSLTNYSIGVTFLADYNHYILDFGESNIKNRLSLYKDASGYLNFRVVDTDKSIYTVSADVSNWINNEAHHVAISWKLNTIDSRDEMHLFVDGTEVPNIIKYGQKLQPYLHEKFRTINPEEIVGLADRSIVGSIDLVTTSGSPIVTSSINFDSYDIFPGDKIYIDEVGFDPSYTINVINGQSLELNQNMPLTLSDGRYSVNRTEYTITSAIDIAPNTAISTIHSILDGYVSGTISTAIVTSTTNFEAEGIVAGYLLRIENNSLPITYTILSVTGTSLTIEEDLPLTITNEPFHIYSLTENEIAGVRALRPSYSISKDGYFNNILTISNDIEANDLILIRTLGLNHRRIRKQYYVWSDNQENILMTRLPPPISLDEAKVTKVILPVTIIGPLNSTLSGGVFYSSNITTSQPTNSVTGRTISATIIGTNTDFSTPVNVNINGVSNGSTITEVLSFTDYGTLDFINSFTYINYISVDVKPTSTTRAALTVGIKEKHEITYIEFDGYGPVVKYSYNIGSGYMLEYNDGYSVKDVGNYFSELDVDNYLLVQYPPAVAGYYKITSVSLDRTILYVDPIGSSPSPIPSFTGGIYKVLNVNDYRSGLQNGFFTFERNDMPNVSYLLTSGFYELDYFTYARIKLDMPNINVYLGSDFNGSSQINAIMDQVKIYSIMLTDTRVGESLPSNNRSVTKDYNSLKALKKDSDTLMLISFDSYPFTNEADFYINSYSDKQKFHSSTKVNDNFSDSLVIKDTPYILSNDGILNSKREGTIEFWTSPLYDTGNDPNVRYYFDATSTMIEETVSTNSTSVKISASASEILSVTLKDGDPTIDYFAGGKLEIDNQRAISEAKTSVSNNMVTVDKPILQVISVVISGDVTETDYFASGSLSTNRRTIYLGKLLPAVSMSLIITYQTLENKNVKLNTQVIRLNRMLPAHKCNVVVKYIPNSTQGDRISIYKDEFGYINFAITASELDYIVRAPTRWIRNTWHKVKATYKVNSGVGQDHLSLFIDGYKYSYDTSVMFGSGVIFGTFPLVLGGVRVGDGYQSLGNIIFKDPINTLYIGSEYTLEKPIFGLMNNIRISNISRPVYSPYGEPIDVSYNSNLEVVYPVTKDLYTTYLSDTDAITVKNEDFATIVNKQTGAFDFQINIFDSFDIVSSNVKAKEALEKLIKVLKPANSKAFITYS